MARWRQPGAMTRWLRAAAQAGTQAIPAGTWRGSQPGVFQGPSPIGIEDYTAAQTVPLGSNGVAPQAVFPSSGSVTAQVGPQGVGESWSLDQCSLSTSVGILDPAECTVYAGPAAIATYQVAANLAGGGSQFGMGGIVLHVGDFVFAAWTGGTSGATAQLSVTGKRTALVRQ